MKVKRILIVILTVALAVCFVVCPLALSTAHADYAPVELEQTEETKTAEDMFLAFLKDKYGEDYENYYNAIIDKWGSVEEYLLALGEKMPQEAQTGWQKFVGWLSEYASVWAPALAVALVILVALVGKKQFNKIVDRIVNAKLKPIENELNLQSKATISIMHSQKALLGSGEKFADNVKELEESEKELTNG